MAMIGVSQVDSRCLTIPRDNWGSTGPRETVETFGVSVKDSRKCVTAPTDRTEKPTSTRPLVLAQGDSFTTVPRASIVDSQYRNSPQYQAIRPGSLHRERDSVPSNPRMFNNETVSMLGVSFEDSRSLVKCRAHVPTKKPGKKPFHQNRPNPNKFQTHSQPIRSPSLSVPSCYFTLATPSDSGQETNRCQCLPSSNFTQVGTEDRFKCMASRIFTQPSAHKPVQRTNRANRRPNITVNSIPRQFARSPRPWSFPLSQRLHRDHCRLHPRIFYRTKSSYGQYESTQSSCPTVSHEESATLFV